MFDFFSFKNDTTLYVAGIVYDSAVDGPGLRNTIFVQGCDHNCKGCHNPHTHEFKVGTAYKLPYTELIEDIAKNSISKKITFSGGDPLYQIDAVYNLSKILIDEGYTDQMLYTGFTVEEIISAGICDNKKCDMMLTSLLLNMKYCVCDPFKIELKTHELPFRGSSNQRVVRFTAGKLGRSLYYEDVSNEFNQGNKNEVID